MTDLSSGYEGYTHEQLVSMLERTRNDGVESYPVYVYREGVKLGELSVSNMSLDCKSNDPVKYSASFTVYGDIAINFNIDRLRPMMRYEYEGNIFQWPLSPPLRIITPSDDEYNEESDSGGLSDVWKMDAYDESVILQENSIGQLIVLPQNQLYTSVVESLLSLKGFYRYNIQPSDKRLSEERVLEPGDKVLEACNQLLREINYRDLEMSKDGILRSYPYTVPTPGDATIHYSRGKQSVLGSPVSTTRDSYNRHNEFIGFYINPETGKELNYTYQNKDPTSPISIDNIGFALTKTIQYQNIPDEESMILDVIRTAREESASYLYRSFPTLIMPQHEVLDVFTLKTRRASGAYQESNWRITISEDEREMTHTGRSVNYF